MGILNNIIILMALWVANSWDDGNKLNRVIFPVTGEIGLRAMQKKN